MSRLGPSEPILDRYPKIGSEGESLTTPSESVVSSPTQQSSQVARSRPEVAGSNPAPATIANPRSGRYSVPGVAPCSASETPCLGTLVAWLRPCRRPLLRQCVSREALGAVLVEWQWDAAARGEPPGTESRWSPGRHPRSRAVQLWRSADGQTADRQPCRAQGHDRAAVEVVGGSRQIGHQQFATPTTMVPDSRTLAATRPSADDSFWFFRIGNRTNALPMPAKATMTSSTAPMMAAVSAWNRGRSSRFSPDRRGRRWGSRRRSARTGHPPSARPCGAWAPRRWSCPDLFRAVVTSRDRGVSPLGQQRISEPGEGHSGRDRHLRLRRQWQQGGQRR